MNRLSSARFCVVSGKYLTVAGLVLLAIRSFAIEIFSFAFQVLRRLYPRAAAYRPFVAQADSDGAVGRASGQDIAKA